MNISDVAKNRANQQDDSFYEEKALITAPIRSDNGYRHYSAVHVEELTLLRRARQVGFNRTSAVSWWRCSTIRSATAPT